MQAEGDRPRPPPPAARNASPPAAIAVDLPARKVTRAVNPSKLSVMLFLVASGISFLFSVYLWFFVNKETGLFVGIWVPSILSLGALVRSSR